MKRHAHRGLARGFSQTLMEFLSGRIGLLGDQFTQALHVHFDHTHPAHGPGRGLSGLAASLLDASGPSGTDIKKFGNLFLVFIARSYAARTRSRRSCEYGTPIRGSLFDPAELRSTRSYNACRLGATVQAPNGRYAWILSALVTTSGASRLRMSVAILATRVAFFSVKFKQTDSRNDVSCAAPTQPISDTTFARVQTA